MKVRQLAISAILVFVSFSSFAGEVVKAPVEIDLLNNFANGSQLAARASKNGVELIGCGAWGIADGQGGGIGYGFCQAVDADGVTAVCQTENDYLLDVIKAVSAYSFIQFSWDENNVCTQIKESNQSQYLPGKRRR